MKKENRGGARKGAGRKQIPGGGSQRVGLRMWRSLLSIVEEQIQQENYLHINTWVLFAIVEELLRCNVRCYVVVTDANEAKVTAPVANGNILEVLALRGYNYQVQKIDGAVFEISHDAITPWPMKLETAQQWRDAILAGKPPKYRMYKKQ